MSGTYVETPFRVYVYLDEDDGEPEGVLRFHRTLYVRHQAGEQVTSEMARAQMEAEIAHYPHARYRAIPVDKTVDLTVRSTVVLP